jgi:hypothetical protein
LRKDLFFRFKSKQSICVLLLVVVVVLNIEKCTVTSIRNQRIFRFSRLMQRIKIGDTSINSDEYSSENFLHYLH